MMRSGVLVVAVSVMLAWASPASGQRVFEGPVPRAGCGPGSQPETGLQGQVPLADRQSGRSQKGYWCNLELVGQSQNQGGSWMFDYYDRCAYYDTHSYSGFGTAVIDAADPAKPKLTTQLRSPAMLGAWESLKVNQPRGMLGATAAYSPAGNGPLYFDVYDVKSDCAQPKLLSSTPIPGLVGHEGNWAPDGKTYYGSGITAIDVSDPAAPAEITTFGTTHGLSISDDGNRAYTTGAGCGNGLLIYDVSQIQARVPDPQTSEVGEVCWEDGGTAQATIPITIAGTPYVLFFDEGGDAEGNTAQNKCCAGAARLIDISNEKSPRVVSKLKLEIHMPENTEISDAETANNGIFGYQAHYCTVDRRTDATTAACGYMQSGMRVFDIRDPLHPREIAYYNPPAQVGKEAQLRGSEHAANTGVNALANSPAPDLTADWCSAQSKLDPARGELWTMCQDNGFLALKFTNGVWPLAPYVTPTTAGLPKLRKCLKGSRVRVRAPRRALVARVYVNGRRVRTVRGRSLRRLITIRLRRGHSVVRIVSRTRNGRRRVQERSYTRCAKRTAVQRG